MRSARKRGVRAGLGLLALLEAFIGGWQYLFPKSFYTGFPTVSLDPPFNEHLMSDVGGLTLAMMVVTGYALVWTERRAVLAAMSGTVVFAGSHLLFHLTHVDGFSPAQAVGVGTSLGIQVLLPVVVLVAAARLPEPAGVQPSAPQGPGTPQGSGVPEGSGVPQGSG